MTKPLREIERWKDPIVAEVRKARERLFAAAGYDLEEFCRRLHESLQHEGPGLTRPLRMGESKTAKGRTRPSTRRAKKARA